MCEIKSRPYFSFNWKMRNTKFKKKTYTKLIYGHVDILWTYSNLHLEQK